jgi:hypothetical protein
MPIIKNSFLSKAMARKAGRGADPRQPACQISRRVATAAWSADFLNFTWPLSILF